MLESVFLNFGSIVFGLIAWILPIVSLVQRNKISHRRGAIFTTASLSACAASLCLQIFELNHRVNIQDWAALMDTSYAVAWIALLFLVVTIVLNVIAVAMHFRDITENA